MIFVDIDHPEYISATANLFKLEYKPEKCQQYNVLPHDIVTVIEKWMLMCSVCCIHNTRIPSSQCCGIHYMRIIVFLVLDILLTHKDNVAGYITCA